MRENRGKRGAPCNNCKGDSNRPCSKCVKANIECVGKAPFRFKETRQLRSNLEFSSDQTWLQPRVSDELTFVDETSDTSQVFVEAGSGPTTEESASGSPEDYNVSFDSERISFDAHIPQQSVSSCRPVARFTAPSIISGAESGEETDTDPILHGERGRPISAQSSRVSYKSGDESGFSYPSILPLTNITNPVQVPGFISKERELTLQEVYLMRHFVEDLAPSHFTYIVPQRAMCNPVLFYAICTASAGHLVRIFAKQWPNKTPMFDNTPLLDLTDETVVEYHNACISIFISMSRDPARHYDENALAAATILRFYEQLDVDLTELDSEIYLGVVRAVVVSQPDYTFGSFHCDYPPLRNADVLNSPFTSLGYSVCLMALRQEIWSVLMNKRPFRLFRRTGKGFNPPAPAGDFEWCNHVIFWCADVLRFCFGDEGPTFGGDGVSSNRLLEWEYLEGFKRNWEAMRPRSFRPLYSRAPDPAKGRFFPEIFHMNDCHVLCLQHFELACILLEVYHPNRRPIGLGMTADNLAVNGRVRQHTLNICGLALSNQKSQATLVTAAIVITMCGEVFRDPAVQKALLDVLAFTKRKHAWPGQSVLLNLQNAWQLNE